MVLESGRRLGQYEIVEPLGAGGMGEVYRATDTRLDRVVAIKVLPEHFAKSPERRTRFEREAKLLAQLHHPNVATLFGLEVADGRQLLVMELVEGETLAERLSRGAIPLEEALVLARDIADALEYAHERGIIHRDLKPANVKLTEDGGAKVLDYGLAKALEDDVVVNATDSQSPTISRALSQSGVILGTAAYMSPEQARGRKLDRRADVWAFGCVLFEMLTGQRAFVGESVTDVLAAIVKEEPAWDLLPASTPTAVRRLLRRCLVKDAKARLRHAGDACIEISEAQERSVSELVVPIPAPQPTRRPFALALVVLGGLLGVILTLWLTRSTGVPPAMLSRPVTASVLDLPPEAPLALGSLVPAWGFDLLSIAISPDGTELVYVGEADGETRLYRRSLNGLQVTEIPGTEGALHPFFSPDGQWVGFLTRNQVKKVLLRGGAPVVLADVVIPVRAFWTSNDMIYVGEREGHQIQRVPVSGGAPVQVGFMEGALSQVLPDGKSALLTSMPNGLSGDYGDIVHLSLDTLETKILIERGYDARYVPTGHLLFARSSNLLSVPFDLERLETRGEPVPVISGVAMGSFFAQAQFAFSNNGSLVYVPGFDTSLGKLAWIDRDGNAELLPLPERLYGVVDLARDDQRLAVQVGDVNDYMWIYDFAREEGRKLPAGMSASRPLFTPEGDAVAFASPSGAVVPMKTYLQAIDGGSRSSGALPNRLSFLLDVRWSRAGDGLRPTEDRFSVARQRRRSRVDCKRLDGCFFARRSLVRLRIGGIGSKRGLGKIVS